MWTTHSAEPAVQPHQRNGSAHVPGRDVSGVQNLNAICPMSSCGSCVSVKVLAGLEHRMHRHGQFSGYCTAARLKPIRSLSLRPHVRRTLSASCGSG